MTSTKKTWTEIYPILWVVFHPILLWTVFKNIKYTSITKIKQEKVSMLKKPEWKDIRNVVFHSLKNLHIVYAKYFVQLESAVFIIADIVDVNEMISFSATETPHWRESKVWTEEICLPRSYRIMNKLKHFITKGDNCTHTNTHTQTLKKNPRILHKHPNFFLWKKRSLF